MASPWKRLVRFEDADGQVKLGQPVDDGLDVGLAVARGEDVEVYLIEGDAFDGVVLQSKARISKLLPPISKEQCSLIRCLGLNYKAHATEAGIPFPEVPILFIKGRQALAGPGDLPVPAAAQDDQLDYETELAVIIGKSCRDVKAEDALSYVLGVTASNDVSARKFQGANAQWCHGKGLDHSCPIGPVMIRPKTAQNLDFTGKLAGKVVQSSNTSDMIFDIGVALAFLSKGTTLEKGSIILMGTPSGIGWLSKPRRIVQNDEVMEIWFDGGIGTLVNKFVFE